MSVFWLIFVFFWGTICSIFGKIQIGVQELRPVSLDRFNSTCAGQNAPIMYDVVGAQTKGTKIWFNTTFTVKEDIPGIPKSTLSLTRCKAQENLDTCELVHNFKSNNYCSMLNTGSDVWSPFYQAYSPPLKCPLKKGVYRGTDSLIDMKAFLLFTAEDWYWKVHSELRDRRTNRILSCAYAEALVTVVRLNQDDLKTAVQKQING